MIFLQPKWLAKTKTISLVVAHTGLAVNSYEEIVTCPSLIEGKNEEESRHWPAG